MYLLSSPLPLLLCVAYFFSDLVVYFSCLPTIPEAAWGPFQGSEHFLICNGPPSCVPRPCALPKSLLNLLTLSPERPNDPGSEDPRAFRSTSQWAGAMTADVQGVQCFNPRSSLAVSLGPFPFNAHSPPQTIESFILHAPPSSSSSTLSPHAPPILSRSQPPSPLSLCTSLLPVTFPRNWSCGADPPWSAEGHLVRVDAVLGKGMEWGPTRG